MLHNAQSQLKQGMLGTLDLVVDEAFILVKAAPRRSESLGETVCCAGINMQGKWVRLYPVSFRHLSDAQRFGRWDHIKYRWSRPKASKDTRKESRRVDPNSIEILGHLKQSDRDRMVNRSLVTSLRSETEAKRSLALLKVEVLDFYAVRLPAETLRQRDAVLDNLRAQGDMFSQTTAIPSRSCPFEFKYRYRDDDGEHEGTCQDWETEQTFFARLRDQASEQAALDWMLEKFGVEYPKQGMALAMGTHRYRLEQWLINGVVRVRHDSQQELFS